MAPVVETTHLTARVPADLAKRLATIAEANERSTSAELRLAIRAYIEQADKPDPTPLREAS